MKVTLRKDFFYRLLFVMCVGVPYINNYELTFVVWSLVAMLTISNSYSLTILRHIFSFAAILAIGLLVTLFHEYQQYYIFRDIAYIVKPLVGFLIGYQLCKRTFSRALELVCDTALVIAIAHYVLLIIGVVVKRAHNLNDLRLYGGYFSDFEVYALVILLFHERFNIRFSKKKLFLYTILIGFSALAYFARTNFIQFILLVMAMKGFLQITRTSLTIVGTTVLFVAVAYSAILYVNPRRNGPGAEAFLYKIKVAPIEPFKTRVNRHDWREFNDNYRSYENIMTVREVSKEKSSLIFGLGIGSKIDLKQELMLGDMKLRYISILHNGFMTVYLKSGIIGVFILLYTIVLLFRNPRSDIPVVRNINLILVGSGVFMIISNWVFMGYYLIADTKAILFAFLICYREMAIKEHQRALRDD